MATSSFSATFTVTDAKEAAELRKILDSPIPGSPKRKNPTINRQKEMETIQRLKLCLQKKR